MAGTGSPKLLLGFDIGSVALKLAIADENANLIAKLYVRTHGRPVETAVRVLGELIERRGADAFDLVAGTGSAGRLICELLGVPFVNEVICQATAVKRLHPEVRTVIEMGGQDSKLIFLPDGAANGRPMTDFSMNTNCAAGTGSFLDQQASRLGLDIEKEFGELALRSKAPPRVAGRCSVFAKSDMIHLQQQAAPVHDIVAGLCMGLARNLKSNLGRGQELIKPIAFCGGVAANAGVVHAIRQVFDLVEGQLVVPEAHAVTGALGAALVTLKERKRRGVEHGRPGRTAVPAVAEPRRTAVSAVAEPRRTAVSAVAEPRRTAVPAVERDRLEACPTGRLDLSPLDGYLIAERSIGRRLDSLQPPSDGYPDNSVLTPIELRALGKNGLIDAYIGVDVGSISTKCAVIDDQNRVLAKTYLMTAGRPLEAVRKVLSEVGAQVGDMVRIKGAATTGSGRYLTGDFIGADMVINEITAQATAAAVIDPAVDTIFEIGGQDSKYISLDGGVVVDFEMNHACAAGTGSFLEEQAERLGVNIKEQFSELALTSGGPIRLGERCTVFMESDLLSYQQQGAKTDDLVAGLCYSIVTNYINRVVGHRRIGERIFFQGGTAFNKGVVSAFEKVTGRRITVPPHHEVTGAIGAAVLARKYQKENGRTESNFGGFERANSKYTVRSFECEHCSNHCEINEVQMEGRDPLSYGSRCDRYNVKKEKDRNESIPNLFVERQRLLVKHANIKKKLEGRKSIGLPLALANYQLLPFFGTLLGELGLNVVLSSGSTKELIHRGVEAVLSTPCFPVKVAHGHVLDLIDKHVDYVWLASVTSMKKEFEEGEYNQPCPYVQTLPYQVTAAVEMARAGGKSNGQGVKLLKLPVRFQEGLKGLMLSLAPLCKEFGVSKRQMRAAIAKADAAQEAFENALRARGKEIIDKLDGAQRAVVVISRPYNGCDAGVSLDLPNKLRKLGVLPIPMDFLDLRQTDGRGDRIFEKMYWKYGQRILRAGSVVRENPRLHAIYLSNFSCGPDSFLISFFKRLMAPKPSLVLEIDEHSADAGVVTRLEAFLESLNNVGERTMSKRLPLYPHRTDKSPQRVLYIPWMGDHAYAMAAAFRACNQPAEVMPMADDQTIELGRRVCSGKECLPCIITTGDMLKVTRRPGFDATKAAFFMPGGSGPCRFGQYNCLQKLLLTEAGHPDVPVISFSQDKEFYDEFKRFDGNVPRLAWYAISGADTLIKAQHATRPYERNAGETDAVYKQCLDDYCRLIEEKAPEAKLITAMRRSAEAFLAIPADRSQDRPKIGVVGEIYVRQHTYANNDLVRQLEQLGAEVSVASLSEWIYYTNWLRKAGARREGAIRQWLGNSVQDFFQRRIEKKLSAPFAPLLGHAAEPPINEVLNLADPYIHSSFEGEAVLSVGKMIEFAHAGCDGVINVMPFSCMPSTIVGGMMKKLTAALGQMPALSISYDGQQDPMLHTRLEAFVYQARAYQGGAKAGTH